MRIQLTAACLLGTLLLPSCDAMKQRVDLSWFGEVMATPQNDSVDVEAGTGLPETEAAASSAVAQTSTPVLPAPPEPKSAPAATTPAPAVAAAPATTAKTYTVVKGDTLNAIAARNKCTPQALSAANGITDPRKLQIGQVLTLPGTGAQPAPQTVVQQAAQPVATAQTTTPDAGGKGTAAWKIWRQNAPATAAAPLYYTVQQGDTMSTIARNHGLTLQSLLTANNMTMQQASALRIGQKIALPAATH